MAEKANPANTLAAQREHSRGRAQTDAARSAQPALDSLFGLQRDLGNQTVVSLFESGLLQAKLRVSQPGDPDEQEADRIADQIVSRQRTPTLHRKCACEGGASCAKCAGEQEDEVIHRSVAPLHSFPLSLQRATADPSANTAPAPPTTASAPGSAAPAATNSAAAGGARRAASLIADDEVASLAPGQMKKSPFLNLLEAAVCATADAELAAVGRSSKSCPYIEKWLAFYRGQSAAHLEQALLKYVPEAAGSTSARDYVAPLRARVRKAVATWSKTGEITGVPADVGLMPSPAQGAGGSAGMAVTNSEVAASAKPATNSDGGVQFKGREGAAPAAADAASVRGQLGHGRALEPAVRSRMGSAFGRDFSSVTVHDDTSAANLSSQLGARAFTVGSDVAFAAGEYRPGTLVGDALIAHELAHVVQQGGTQSREPMRKGEGDYNALEADADAAAVGAVAASWAGAKGRLSEIGKNATPRLASGLRLQRCSRSKSAPAPGPFEFAVRGKSQQADPGMIYFVEGSSALDGPEKTKVDALALPAADMLTLNGFTSEEEDPAAALATINARLDAVAAELVAAGHDPAKIGKVPKPTSGQGRIEYRELRSVEILKPGVASAVPAAAAPTTNPCAGTDESNFVDAETEAESMIATSVTALGPPIDPAMAPLLTRFFRGWTPGDAASVKTNLGSIKTQLHVLLNAANHRCGTVKYAACGTSDAENSGDGAAAMMTVCPSFLSAGSSKKERAGTLIHESAHGTPGVDTQDRAYAHERLIEFLSAADGLKNSDSYVLLVRLFDTPGSMNVGPVAKDVLTGPMGPGEPDAARRTIAWLEKWLIWSYQELGTLYDTINESITAGSWTNSYYRKTMELTAPLFGLTAPPTIPSKADQFKIAAIYDRFHTMRYVEFQTAVTINKVAAGTEDVWAAGPGTSVNLTPAFFAATPRQQLDRMLTAIVKATPDISPGFVSKYVTLADLIRKHQHGGEPT
jgi:hypothetical protein